MIIIFSLLILIIILHKTVFKKLLSILILFKQFTYLCIHFIHGVDWFRQQDQWVSKHAENRSAISIIPCYKILTGNEEFALAA